jgi:formate-dependent nitrite reductase cytochrome c552 subunit
LYGLLFTIFRVVGAATSQTDRQSKVAELAEDIQDLKAFLNSQCGLPKSTSGRCAEALVVDYNIASVALMKRKSRADFAAILSSIGLSADETALVIEVTHPAVTHASQSNRVIVALHY